MVTVSQVMTAKCLEASERKAAKSKKKGKLEKSYYLQITKCRNIVNDPHSIPDGISRMSCEKNLIKGKKSTLEPVA